MKFAAGVLTVLMAPWGLYPPRTPPAAVSPIPAAPDLSAQEWLADPVLPSCFHIEESALEMEWSDEALSLDIPPLVAFAPVRQDPPPSSPADSPETESSFPRAINGLDIQAWREEDDLRQIREWAGEALLGMPVLVPQLVLEAFLPRGLRVGPATFLYRTSSGSSTLALVVLDQILFHEAEFLASARSQGLGGSADYADSLKSGQRRVLRKSFLGGFRAGYAMPGLTMDLALQSAADHGVVGYLLAPSIGGAVLYFKGIDQRVRLHEQMKVRFKVASGRDWIRGIHSDDGIPALSFEIRFCDFPVGLVGSFDATSRGMVPAFIGLGTSLDAVEDLLGLEEIQQDPSRFR